MVLEKHNPSVFQTVIYWILLLSFDIVYILNTKHLPIWEKDGSTKNETCETPLHPIQLCAKGMVHTGG